MVCVYLINKMCATPYVYFQNLGNLTLFSFIQGGADRPGTLAVEFSLLKGLG